MPDFSFSTYKELQNLFEISVIIRVKWDLFCLVTNFVTEPPKISYASFPLFHFLQFSQSQKTCSRTLLFIFIEFLRNKLNFI